MTGVFVMFAGIGIIGALASILASLLVSSSDDNTDAEAEAQAAGPRPHAATGSPWRRSRIRASARRQNWPACGRRSPVNGPRSRPCAPRSTPPRADIGLTAALGLAHLARPATRARRRTRCTLAARRGVEGDRVDDAAGSADAHDRVASRAPGRRLPHPGTPADGQRACRGAGRVPASLRAPHHGRLVAERRPRPAIGKSRAPWCSSTSRGSPPSASDSRGRARSGPS